MSTETLVSQEKLMKSLLAKLYSILTGGDENLPKSKDNFIAWCTPGIPFQKEDLQFAVKGLNGADANETKDLLATASDFSRLVNLIPDPSGLYTEEQQQAVYDQAGSVIWDVYSNVLKYSQVSSGELSDEEQKKIKKFRDLLAVTKEKENLVTGEKEMITEDGPVLKAYNQYMSEYLDAATEYNNKRLSALNSESNLIVQDWALNAPNYRRRLKAAYDNWVSKGYKNEVEDMNAFINQVTQKDLTLLKADLQQKFEQGKMTDLLNNSDFYLTSFYPNDFVNSDKGWSRFDFNTSSYSSYEKNETNSWEGGGGLRFGLFSLSGGSSGTISKFDKTVDTSDFSMSFSLVQVPISRPWFSPEFLTNTAWRFDPSMGMNQLSDGNVPPSGQMAAYPTTAVFVKDIVINFKDVHNSESAFNSEIKVNASVGWGPFRIGGSYTRHKSEKKINNKIDEQGLKVEGMQLIALKCAVLPQAPNPNPDISNWV